MVHRSALTHCALVTPYGDIDQGQHCFKYNGLLPDGNKSLSEPMWLIINKLQWDWSGGNSTRDNLNIPEAPELTFSYLTQLMGNIPPTGNWRRVSLCRFMWHCSDKLSIIHHFLFEGHYFLLDINSAVPNLDLILRNIIIWSKEYILLSSLYYFDALIGIMISSWSYSMQK